MGLDTNKSVTKSKRNIHFNEKKFDQYFFHGIDNRQGLLKGIMFYTNRDVNKENVDLHLMGIFPTTEENLEKLRKKLQKKGYYIKDEKVIFDKFYYVIGYYKYGQGPRINNYVSPFLINNIEYMRYLLNKYQIKFIHEKKFLVKLKYHLIIKKIKKHVK